MFNCKYCENDSEWVVTDNEILLCKTHLMSCVEEGTASSFNNLDSPVTKEIIEKFSKNLQTRIELLNTNSNKIVTSISKLCIELINEGNKTALLFTKQALVYSELIKKLLARKMSIQEAKKFYNTEVTFLKVDPIEKFVKINDFFSQKFFRVSQNIVIGMDSDKSYDYKTQIIKQNYENKLSPTQNKNSLIPEGINMFYNGKKNSNELDSFISFSNLNTKTSISDQILKSQLSDDPNIDKNFNAAKFSNSKEKVNEKKSLVKCIRCKAVYNGNKCTVCNHIRNIE
ncbi:hypothetical protein SteCoe_13097 [Stentor coeruleus]|uniref:Uncharacterized protein n=1 Tax=Stentor coeruleus TaxID=5963 RepID=A0A1R2C9B3_9CILI|nr:hypothetical protein SteCoe_13097 [Stentor coeruleus]